MSRLRVRAYNVRFGDALLVTWPEGKSSRRRNLLVDVGNVLSTEGGDDTVFEPVVQDIVRELDGRPLDLYVSTHEHLDHTQGLPYASRKLGIDLDVRYAWLSASADPSYYDKNEKARRSLELARTTFTKLRQNLLAAGDPNALPVWARTMLANNDGLLADGSPSNVADCVDYLRQLGDKTFYVHRDLDVAQAHPFDEAEFSIWAPEEDTSVYYGRFEPAKLQPLAPLAQDWATADSGLVPPSGVDAGSFYDLLTFRQQGNFDNLLAIDRAANNTSIVFCLRWQGWNLLFPGDAEERSWKTMAKHGVLEPVHFLKVAHHGSANGTPEREILDSILPAKAPDRRSRHALVSTYRDTYSGVPSAPTLRRIGRRTQLHNTLDVKDGGHLDIYFNA